MIEAIISGFQTGADMGGILAAVELGIGTGGYMPKGWRTENRHRPEYEEKYGAIETDSEDYIERTRKNVETGDATVIFGHRSPGSNRTEEFARELQKPCCWVIWPPMLEWPQGAVKTGSNGTFYIYLSDRRPFKLWLARTQPLILNVAGNRESKNPGIEEFVKSFLIKTLTRREHV